MGPAETVAIRLRDGSRADRRLSAGGHAELYSEVVHSRASGLVEVVGARRSGDGNLGRMRRHARGNFLPAGDRRLLRAKAEILDSSGMEVFTTPAALHSPEPGDAAVGELNVVWIDVDERTELDRLRAFAHPPHLIAYSGGADSGVHAYWRLSFPLPPAEGERAMRMLASHLAGDRASTNRGRLMRVPGTRHRKAGERWCRVACADLARPPYDLPVLTEGLVDPKEHAPANGAGGSGGQCLELERVAPPAYFRAIAGIPVPAEGGYVSCPTPGHEDRHPSAMVYAEPGRGWCCFACTRSGRPTGGGAVDLVSALEGGPTGRELRGDDFRAAKAKALDALGLEQEHKEMARC